ncbi:RING-H2 finger protein ATL52-like [Tripterygium wilfordii]|uniref:RING-H2 finger protein ATL52-like n=1 Tax=Tripterygium wilfordii TaxID=458696 RepID=A0A7J7CVE7_TRIWF|nr:RING-H2 finger protein ATL52-like [Tripterygium wilfordii]
MSVQKFVVFRDRPSPPPLPRPPCLIPVPPSRVPNKDDVKPALFVPIFLPIVITAVALFGLIWQEEDNVVNNDSELAIEQMGGDEVRIEDHNNPVEANNTNVEDLRKKSKHLISRNYPSRVQSDLAENRQASTEGGVQPRRRSVSMDSLVSIKNLKSKIYSKRRSGSFSMIKLARSSSIEPILMKRSSTSSGKASSSSGRSSSHDSILPL